MLKHSFEDYFQIKTGYFLARSWDHFHSQMHKIRSFSDSDINKLHSGFHFHVKRKYPSENSVKLGILSQFSVWDSPEKVVIRESIIIQVVFI